MYSNLIPCWLEKPFFEPEVFNGPTAFLSQTVTIARFLVLLMILMLADLLSIFLLRPKRNFVKHLVFSVYFLSCLVLRF